MLDSAAVSTSMSQALGNGVIATILLNENGVLLSSASIDSDYNNSKERSMIIAATGNIWRAYAYNALATNKLTNQVEPEALEQVLMDFGNKKLCAMSVGGAAIICLVGSNVEIGFLKLKTAALQRRLDTYLRPVLAVSS